MDDVSLDASLLFIHVSDCLHEDEMIHPQTGDGQGVVQDFCHYDATLHRCENSCHPKSLDQDNNSSCS